VPAGRGQAEEAGRHAQAAEEAVASLDYGQEKLDAAMARALIGQASGDYLDVAGALEPWRADAALGLRGWMPWRPLLAEGLIGSGQLERAAAVVDQLRADGSQVSYPQPARAWLTGGWPGQHLRQVRLAGTAAAAALRRPVAPAGHGLNP
jgi:hypothetical protein